MTKSKQTKMKTNNQKADQCRKILSMIRNRIVDLQVLKGDILMTNKCFRMVLKEHSSIREEFETLESRKFKIERRLWKVA